MTGTRYNYTVTTTLHGICSKHTCKDVKSVVHTINSQVGYNIVTRDMVYAHFTRPNVANKRLFDSTGSNGKISIERERILTKGEVAHVELAMIDALTN